VTLRQRRFIAEYLIDCNATQAAIRAGYSSKTATATASRLLTNVDLKHAIETAQTAAERRNNLTVDWVLGELQGSYRRALEQGKLSAANRALELLGKHLGMFDGRGAGGLANDNGVNLATAQRRRAFFTELGQVLAPFPEAKAAVGQLLEKVIEANERRALTEPDEVSFRATIEKYADIFRHLDEQNRRNGQA
jgi:phage terminase small subunit